MYCSECGTKNSNTSKFCENCGAPLETKQAKNNSSTTSKKNIIKDSSSTPKVIIIVAAIVVLIGGVLGYNTLKKKTLPETIAKQYFEAYKNSNSKKMYNLFDIDESLKTNEFTTKDMFVKTIITETQKKEAAKIQGYQVIKVEPSIDGLTTKVTINYTTTSSLTSKSMTINLKKAPKNKYLFFANWKVSLGDNYIKENYTISLPKGSNATLQGKELSKYKEKSSSTTYDVYKIPKIFRGEYELKAKLSYGFDLQEKINTSLGSTYTVNISKSTIPEKTQKSIKKQGKDLLTTFYQSAIEKKAWEDIKGNFKGLDDTAEQNFKATYEKIIATSNNDSKQLTKYDISDFSITDIKTSTNSYGDLTVTFNVKYNYSINYKSLFQTEMKSKTSSSSASIKMDFKYSNKEFIISHINTFIYSFN